MTVRDVPDSVLYELAARAAQAGQPLQECLRQRLITEAERTRADDVIARARAQSVRLDVDAGLSLRG
jgi:plasmid stability protein